VKEDLEKFKRFVMGLLRWLSMNLYKARRSTLLQPSEVRGGTRIAQVWHLSGIPEDEKSMTAKCKLGPDIKHLNWNFKRINCPSHV